MVGRGSPTGDETFVGCVAGNLRAATRAVTRLYDEQLRPHGVRITQVAILAQLQRSEPASIGVLADRLGIERSGLAREVKLLESARLVESMTSREDGRVRLISLTKNGRRRLVTCAPAWRTAQKSMRDLLGEQAINDLVAAAGAVVERLSGTALTTRGTTRDDVSEACPQMSGSA